MQAIIDVGKKVKQMLQDGVIKPAVSPWSLPVVKKKNGKNKFFYRFPPREQSYRT